MTTSYSHAVYLPPPEGEAFGLTAERGAVLIELTNENRQQARGGDSLGPLDLLDQPGLQEERYGRVVARRATVEEAQA